MHEQRITLGKNTLAILNAKEQQIQKLQQEKSELLTATVEGRGMDVSNVSNVRQEGNQLVITIATKREDTPSDAPDRDVSG